MSNDEPPVQAPLDQRRHSYKPPADLAGVSFRNWRNEAYRVHLVADLLHPLPERRILRYAARRECWIPVPTDDGKRAGDKFAPAGMQSRISKYFSEGYATERGPEAGWVSTFLRDQRGFDLAWLNGGGDPLKYLAGWDGCRVEAERETADRLALALILQDLLLSKVDEPTGEWLDQMVVPALEVMARFMGGSFQGGMAYHLPYPLVVDPQRFERISQTAYRLLSAMAFPDAIVDSILSLISVEADQIVCRTGVHSVYELDRFRPSISTDAFLLLNAHTKELRTLWRTPVPLGQQQRLKAAWDAVNAVGSHVATDPPPT